MGGNQEWKNVMGWQESRQLAEAGAVGQGTVCHKPNPGMRFWSTQRKVLKASRGKSKVTV